MPSTREPVRSPTRESHTNGSRVGCHQLDEPSGIAGSNRRPLMGYQRGCYWRGVLAEFG